MSYLALCLLEGGSILVEKNVDSLNEARAISRGCFLKEADAKRTVVMQVASGQIIAAWDRKDLE